MFNSDNLKTIQYKTKNKPTESTEHGPQRDKRKKKHSGTGSDTNDPNYEDEFMGRSSETKKYSAHSSMRRIMPLSDESFEIPQ